MSGRRFPVISSRWLDCFCDYWSALLFHQSERVGRNDVGDHYANGYYVNNVSASGRFCSEAMHIVMETER